MRPLQPEPQTPPVQDCPWGQALPQRPQLALLVPVFTQVEPQSVRPPVHPHCPEAQTWPAGQASPQLPQFFGSVEGFTQAGSPPVGHGVKRQPQVPLLQVNPDPACAVQE